MQKLVQNKINLFGLCKKRASKLEKDFRIREAADLVIEGLALVQLRPICPKNIPLAEDRLEG